MVNNISEHQFERELEELRTAYLTALPEKINLVQKAWSSLDLNEWDPAAYQAVYRLIHNLAGGAGTYGLTSITHQARSVLTTMKPWLDNEQPPTTDMELQISQGIEIIKKATDNVLTDKQEQTFHLRKPPKSQLIEVLTSEIYLVEDDPAQALYIKLHLEQAGHRVQVFGTLEDVRVAMQAMEPTAILMDMVFPEGELAGAQTIAEIQESVSIRVPIIFISTRTDLEARLCAVRAGADHYFTKPVNVDGLINILDDYRKTAAEDTKKILLIDDDPAVSQLFSVHLSKEPNIEATVLNEPLDVLETLDSIRPDLILMDYHMPRCNGLELAAVLRQHETYSKTPIIFLTEETDLETQLTALNLGSDDFFTKSMGPDRLVFAVQSKLDRIDSLTKKEDLIAWKLN